MKIESMRRRGPGFFGGLVLLFLLVPAAELLLLIYLGKIMGFWPTAALILSTGVLGAWLARREGFRVLGRIQREMEQGRMPAKELFEGLMVLVAGAFLLTPGLLTDISGFLLLIPPLRAGIVMRVAAYLSRRFEISRPETIEAEWWHED